MKIMGHRGARDSAPENTIRSFLAFVESKHSVVEFDIHSTKDNVWVVHHDSTIDRMTKSQGKISEMTFEEVSKVVGIENDPISSLTEVLKLFKNTQIEMQIEIKSLGDFQALKNTIIDNSNLNFVTIISFNHRLLFLMKSLIPQIKTFCLLEGLPMKPSEIIRSCNADGISLSIRTIDSELVSDCHKNGFLVTAWNANDYDTYKRMKDIGVDILGTDRPFEMINWQKEK